MVRYSLIPLSPIRGATTVEEIVVGVRENMDDILDIARKDFGFREMKLKSLNLEGEEGTASLVIDGKETELSVRIVSMGNVERVLRSLPAGRGALVFCGIIYQLRLRKRHAMLVLLLSEEEVLNIDSFLGSLKESLEEELGSILLKPLLETVISWTLTETHRLLYIIAEELDEIISVMKQFSSTISAMSDHFAAVTSSQRDIVRILDRYFSLQRNMSKNTETLLEYLQRLLKSLSKVEITVPSIKKGDAF